MKKTDLKKVIESTEAKLEKIENAQQELDQKITLTQVTIEKLETSIEQMRKIEASASKKTVCMRMSPKLRRRASGNKTLRDR